MTYEVKYVIERNPNGSWWNRNKYWLFGVWPTIGRQFVNSYPSKFRAEYARDQLIAEHEAEKYRVEHMNKQHGDPI